MKMTTLRYAGGVAVVLVGVFLGGYGYGVRTTTLSDEARFQQREDLKGRIMGWVVERNPEARIRDFQGFPDALFRTAQEIGIEWEWLLALADKESGMRPEVVGMGGEIGLMQILPATGRAIAQKLGEEFDPPKVGGRERSGRPAYASLGTLGDPRVNLRWGGHYLKWQKDQFRSWPTTLRAYNRRPEHARQVRPWDRYAEEVTFRFVDLREQFRFSSRL